MFCANCGNQLKEGAMFCGKCGHKVKVAATGEMTVADQKEDSLGTATTAKLQMPVVTAADEETITSKPKAETAVEEAPVKDSLAETAAEEAPVKETPAKNAIEEAPATETQDTSVLEKTPVAEPDTPATAEEKTVAPASSVVEEKMLRTETPAVGPMEGKNKIGELPKEEDVVLEETDTTKEENAVVQGSVPVVEAVTADQNIVSQTTKEASPKDTATQAPGKSAAETTVQPDAISEKNDVAGASAVPAEEKIADKEKAPKKKSKTGLVVVILLLLLLAGGSVACYFFWPQISQTLGLDKFFGGNSEVVNSGEGAVDPENTADPQATPEPTEAPTPDPTVVPVIEEEKPQPVELLEQYYASSLKTSFGEVDYAKKMEQSYLQNNEDLSGTIGYSPLTSQSGILSKQIMDLEGDGQEELFVLILKTPEGNNSIFADLMYQVYEVQEGAVVLSCEGCINTIGGTDFQECVIATKINKDGVLFVQHNENGMFAFADGAEYALSVWKYNGTEVETCVDVAFRGSDFSECNEMAWQYRDTLKGLGLTNTADNLDYTLEVSSADRLQTILIVNGFNPKVFYPENVIGRIDEEYGPADWGRVEYRFYQDEQDRSKKNQIQSYDVETHDYSLIDGDQKIISCFDNVVFKGPYQENIEWINDLIRAYETYYFEKECTQEDIKEYMQTLKNYPDDLEWEYKPHYINHVSFDQEGQVSVCWRWYWYMGGSNSQGWTSLDFNAQTGEFITIPSVFGTTAFEATDYIAENLVKDIKKQFDYDYELPSYIDVYALPFYYDDETVTIYFNSYELNGMGNTSWELILKRDMSGLVETVVDQEEPEPGEDNSQEEAGNTDPENNEETETPNQEEIPSGEDMIEGYLLENSDSELITMAQLQALTAQECNLAMWEIYARHGVIFESDEEKAYFEKCTWYVPAIEFSELTENDLSEMEKQNIKLIESYLMLLGE